jgi:RNA polymerase sigma factor (sigma-70 family)
MDDEVGGLVRAAAAGDQVSWERLVDLFSGLIWSIARAHGLSRSDAADVSQTTWLKLVEYVGRLRDPNRVGAWLAATARHECIRSLRRTARHMPAGHGIDLEDLPVPVVESSSEEDAILTSERDAVLWRSLQALPERCRLLIRILLAEPRPSYEDVAEALEMPIGSIGPTRARCLERLRQDAELAGVTMDTDEYIPNARRPRP